MEQNRLYMPSKMQNSTEIIIDNPKTEFNLDFDSENPLIEILSMEYESEEGQPLYDRYLVKFFSVNDAMRSPEDVHPSLKFPIRFKHVQGAKRVIVKYDGDQDNFQPIRIVYRNSVLGSIRKPLSDFDRTISYTGNRRIFFSGKFGSGKTTFLNEFFDQNANRYNVFRIHPVHYSIAQNEDIFRYIKADLLYHLVTQVPPELIDHSNQSLVDHLSMDIYNSGFTKVLMKYGGILSSLGKYIPSEKAKLFFGAIAVVLSMRETIEKESKDKNQEDWKLINTFFSDLSEQEGSLLEYNSISGLIDYFLSCVKESDGKQNVLLIDDLDRIDPDHIFRILNVISAHFDPAITGETNSIRYGFDKVILVADIENIEGVYNHRFGLSADFAGYMDKFFSTEPYYFDNEAALEEVCDIFLEKVYISRRVKFFHPTLDFILTILRKNGLLTLRDMIRLNHASLYLEDSLSVRYNFDKKSGISAPLGIINLLTKVWSISEMRKKVNIMRQTSVSDNQGMLYQAFLRFLPLLGVHDTETYTLGLPDGRNAVFTIRSSFDNDILEAEILEQSTESSTAIVKISQWLKQNEITLDLFYELFLMQLDLYNKDKKTIKSKE